MNKLFVLPVLALLSACGQEPAPAPQPTATAAAASPTEGLPAPDQELFTKTFAETCPEAEPISNAVCKRAGLGSAEVICEYGVGEDNYLRHTTTLVAGEGKWALAEPEKLCAEHGSHHKDS
jgi:hypothetical protein